MGWEESDDPDESQHHFCNNTCAAPFLTAIPTIHKYICTLILQHSSFPECLDAKQNRNKEIRHEVSGKHQAFQIQDVQG